MRSTRWCTVRCPVRGTPSSRAGRWWRSAGSARCSRRSTGEPARNRPAPERQPPGTRRAAAVGESSTTPAPDRYRWESEGFRSVMSEGGHGTAPPMADPVTGAVPRALLQPMLADALARADRDGTRCAVFLFDVDFFKTVNDAYGHLRGDEVLRQLADRVKGLVRGYDELFRYGGDEFVLLLPEVSREEAVRLALQLTDEVRGGQFPGGPARPGRRPGPAGRGCRRGSAGRRCGRRADPPGAPARRARPGVRHDRAGGAAGAGAAHLRDGRTAALVAGRAAGVPAVRAA